MKMKFKMLVVSAVLISIVAFIWFYIIPRQRFHLGMKQSEIEAVCGPVKVIPLASLLSSPPTDFEKEHTPLYWIRGRPMGVNLYLNFYKQVVCVEFLFGSTLGTKEVVKPHITGN